MMSLNITERSAGDVTILDLEGNIVMGEGTARLRETLRRLIEGDKKKILLNMAKVRFVDSSGMGALVYGYAALDRRGGELKLLNVAPNLKELLAVTKVLPIFPVYHDEQKALREFKSSGE